VQNDENAKASTMKAIKRDKKRPKRDKKIKYQNLFCVICRIFQINLFIVDI
jgi:hypothetical protein